MLCLWTKQPRISSGLQTRPVWKHNESVLLLHHTRNAHGLHTHRRRSNARMCETLVSLVEVFFGKLGNFTVGIHTSDARVGLFSNPRVPLLWNYLARPANKVKFPYPPQPAPQVMRRPIIIRLSNCPAFTSAPHFTHTCAQIRRAWSLYPQTDVHRLQI